MKFDTPEKGVLKLHNNQAGSEAAISRIGQKEAYMASYIRKILFTGSLMLPMASKPVRRKR